MRCPSCKEINRDRVVDSRMTDGGSAIRRRRECLACGRRYTTKERIENSTRLTVVKKDGTRMPFDSERLLNGIRQACYKRAIAQDRLVALAEGVEDELTRDFEREVPSRVIGGRVARALRVLDQVAYVRFASVYRDFEGLDDLLDDLEQVRDAADSPGQQQMFE